MQVVDDVPREIHRHAQASITLRQRPSTTCPVIRLSQRLAHVAGRAVYCVHHHVFRRVRFVLNVELACNDIRCARGSLLDFVEKLIHRLVEYKKRLLVT